MRRLRILLPLAALCVVTACGKGDTDAAPAIYTLEGDSIPAFDQLLTEETGGVLAYTFSQGIGGDGAAAEETNGDTVVYPSMTYDYQQFAEGTTGALAESYVTLLTNEENALEMDDKEVPSYTGAVGSVLLYRQAVALDETGSPIKTAAAGGADGEQTEDEEAQAALTPYADYEKDSEMRFQVRIDWTPSSCLVTLSRVPHQALTANSLLGENIALSFSSAKDLMLSLSPAEIGLPGATMAEYSLKPGPGFVLVEDVPCLVVYVFGKNNTNTNSRLGTYFISADGAELFRETAPGEVKQIVLQENPKLPSYTIVE